MLLFALACDPEPPPQAAPAPIAPEPKRIDRDPGPPDGLAPDGRTAVLFISDTLGANHAGFCGHERPTTPTMDALAAKGAHACDAVSTGTWTLPGHAGMFTGLGLPEHGAHRYPVAAEGCGVHYVTDAVAGPRQTLLMESLADAGWRTVCVVENPIISDKFGLATGCQTWIQTPKGGTFTLDAVREEVGKDDPRPLFLLVNVMNAHSPWTAIPEGLDWIEARPKLASDQGLAQLIEKRNPTLQAHAHDLYDYGVYLADQKLAAVLEVVEPRSGARYVVATSDHGHMLGEDGQLGHASAPFDGVVRVPLVATGFTTPWPQGPTSTAFVHALFSKELLDQEPPQPPVPPVSIATPSEFWWNYSGQRYGKDYALAAYTSTGRTDCDRIVCTGPDADAPQHESWTAMLNRVTREAPCEQSDLEQQETLRALGYID